MRNILIVLIFIQGTMLHAIDVTFEVNMSLQIERGVFDPNSDFVDVAGTFNDWGGRVDRLSAVGDDLYRVTVPDFSAGQQLEFKFRFNGSWDGREEFPGVGNNRMHTVQNGENLISVWYNNEQGEGAAPLAILNLPHSSIFSESTLIFQNRSQGEYSNSKWTVRKGHITETIEEQHLTYTFQEAGNYKIELEVTNAAGLASITEASLNVMDRNKGELSWWNNEVFYEIFVRSFKDSDGDGVGDFNGLTEKLDYLNNAHDDVGGDLGVTGLWLMPIHPSDSYHGYDVIDYREIHPDFGSMDDFKAFLEQAHNRGIKVIIDYVMNHTSSKSPWFEASSNPASGQRDWYVWSDNNPNMQGPWGQKAWHEKNGDFYYAVFWHEMPDLNYFNEEVKAEMFDIADYWLNEIGIDGFRLDAVRYMVEDESGLDDSRGTIQFWKEYNDEIKTMDSDALSIGEAWTNTSGIQDYTRNEGLDLCFEFDLSYAIIDAVNNHKSENLLEKISQVYAIYPHNQWGSFLSNHDQDRIIESFGGDTKKLKTAAAIQLTLPGVPFIYYGNEIGMNGRKPDEFIRRPMQWDSGLYAGFSDSQPWIALNNNYADRNVATMQSESGSLLNHYTELIGHRQNNEALRLGDFVPILFEGNGVLAYERNSENQSLIVAHNLSNADQSFDIRLEGANMEIESILIKEETDWSFSNGLLSISGLKAGETVIIQTRLITGLFEIPELDKINVHPNPTRGILNISSVNSDFDTFTITNVNGQMIRKGKFESNQIDISNLSEGVYFLLLGSNEEYIGKTKFVVQ